MGETRFTTAAVIGTGMMGPGIALTLAMGGLRSTILGRTGESAARGLEKARAQARLLAENELAGAGLLERAAGLLDASCAFDDTIRAADLVIESGPEDMAFKQALFARMDALAGPRAVLASNTSGLSITAIAAGCSRPERVLTTHFWNPPHLMPLVEIVKAGKTSGKYFRELVRRGDLGSKTGKGFYDWSIKDAGAVRQRRDQFLVEVLHYRRRNPSET